MADKSQRKAVRSHRRRLKERGLKRVEVHASASDAALLRDLAKALREDGEAADKLRTSVRRAIKPEAQGLKALLAEAPLEGIRIKRSRDRGRVVEL